MFAKLESGSAIVLAEINGLPEGAVVPKSNGRWVDVEQWIAENGPLPDYEYPPEAPDVPVQVTMRQARAALIITGNIDLIQPAIDAIADPVERALAQNEWDRSQTVERNRGLVQQLGAQLFTKEQLDDLFILADQQA